MEDFIEFEEFFGLSGKGARVAGADVALRTFQNKVLQGEPQEKILNYVFDALGVFIPFDRVGIALADGEWLRSRWTKSRLPVEYLPVGYAAKITGSSLEEILNTGKPRVISDLHAYLNSHPASRSTALIVKDGMDSSLTFPLSLHGRPFGVVFFSSAKSHAYTIEHMHILESVAQGLAIAVDRAQIEKSRAKIQDQEKMISRMMHDLRSPLAVMVGFADLLGESVDVANLTKDARKQFEVIRRNAHLVLDLVDDLSDYEVLRLNALAVRKAKVALDDFLTETADALQPICSAKDMGLIRHNPEPGQEWNFDRRRIRQVLENLISNAVKFSHPGGTAVLSAWFENGRLYFSVADKGQGIAAADMSKLFREFGVTSSKATAGERSTGLGLVICKQIVAAHGGEITVSSEPGQGSTFEFWLPA